MTDRTLGCGDIHVWRVSLAGDEALCAARAALLSPDERARADRFRLARDRRRSILARSALRLILADYLSAVPDALCFAYGPHGKPALSGAFAPLSFNVSHSDDLALIAVSEGGSVGVDIERIRADVEGSEIAERFFCPAERAWLQSLPRAHRPDGFFTLWTRKEAYIKARGSGLWHDLQAFDVSQSPPLAVKMDDRGSETSWYIQDLTLEAGFAGALAVEGVIGRILSRRFEESLAP